MMHLNTKKKLGLLLCSAVVLLAGVRTARAVSGIQNGDFSGNGGSGQLTVNTTLSDWTGGGHEGGFGSQTTPPVFVFTAGTPFATGDAFMGTVGFYDSPQLSAPGNGIVVAADGDPAWAGSLSQTVNGLIVGATYDLTFNWAGAQQQGFSGATTESWQVALGSSTQSTATVNTPSQGFSGWQSATMDFVATSPSELLNFTAIGAPSGQPPWLLLNDVQLNAVPEPSSLLMTGLGGVIFVGCRLRHRFRAAKK
jgi:hypothetical protein